MGLHGRGGASWGSVNTGKVGWRDMKAGRAWNGESKPGNVAEHRVLGQAWVPGQAWE